MSLHLQLLQENLKRTCLKSSSILVNSIDLYFKGLSSHIDLRSLAVWRMLTGFAILYDLIFYKIFALETYYLSSSLRPASAVIPYFGSGFRLVERLGDTGFTLFIYSTLICAICFTIGLFGNYLKLILFILYSLVIVNSFYLLNGFHFMVLVSIFWTLFLPTGAVWSVAPSKDSYLHPLAVFGLYLQIALIYMTSFLVKNGDIWLQGHAIELIVNDEYYASGFAFMLRGHLLVCKILNYGALVWEFLIPIFILIPLKPKFKVIAAIMIIALHLGIAMIVQVGPFLLIGMALSATLLPKQFWLKLKFLKMPTHAIKLKSLFINLDSSCRTLVLLVMLVVMIKGNLRIWYKDSYLSGFLQSIPGSEVLFNKQWFPGFILYGFSDQPWVFFQMTTTSNLGLYVIVEENDKGVFFLSGKPISSLKQVEKIVFNTGFKHRLDHSDFIYMSSLKLNPERFPNEVYNEILINHERLHGKKASHINKRTLYYLSKIPIWDKTRYSYTYELKYLSAWRGND